MVQAGRIVASVADQEVPKRQEVKSQTSATIIGRLICPIETLKNEESPAMLFRETFARLYMKESVFIDLSCRMNACGEFECYKLLSFIM